MLRPRLCLSPDHRWCWLEEDQGPYIAQCLLGTREVLMTVCARTPSLSLLPLPNAHALAIPPQSRRCHSHFTDGTQKLRKVGPFAQALNMLCGRGKT